MPKMEIRQEVRTNDTLDIYLYDNVEGDSYNWWTGEKTESETSANYFKNLLEEHKNVKNINIFINSLGGSVYEGIAIYTNLKRHSAYKTVYIDGFACSIASVIAMAGDKIIMPKNTLMMVHNVWTYAAGNAEELRKVADDLEKMNTLAVESYLDKAGDKLTEEKVRELMNAETYLTAAECVEYGLADEHTDVEADINKAKEMFNQAKTSGIKAYTSQLEKICALANKPPEDKPEPEPEKPEEPQPEEPKQETKDKFKLFEKYFFNKGE
jgi:ATP-dependent Clp protease protease subunit